MGKFKEIFKPTKGKIILTIVLFFMYYVAASLSMRCPEIAKMCVVNAGTSGAVEQRPGEYAVGAKHAPLSCEQFCSNTEYTSILVNTLIFNFIVQIIVIYIVSALLVFGFNRFRE